MSRLGGIGIAIAVDHLSPGDVKTLADQVGSAHGHIDILVNDIWGAEVLKGGPSEWKYMEEVEAGRDADPESYR